MVMLGILAAIVGGIIIAVVWTQSTSATPFTVAMVAVATPTPTPDPSATVPGQITGLTATALSPDAIALAWDTPDTGGAGLVRLEVHRVNVNAATTTILDDPALTQHTDTGLSPATDYIYTVGAVNRLGHGSRSAPITVATNALPTPTPLP